jgi:hypothetical protein
MQRVLFGLIPILKFKVDCNCGDGISSLQWRTPVFIYIQVASLQAICCKAKGGLIIIIQRDPKRPHIQHEVQLDF